MGLDSVELIMAVEEAFGIEIANAEAETIVTVGDLLQIVLHHLPESERSETVWPRLREVIIEDTGVKPDLVTLDAEIVRDLGID